ncbi:zinc ribbon domain-containing protein [Natronobiforma cellulositropha]|uniref:zinc ribbon domain-containing protein n=1 Tax=Natronobiforma cellulositropha TaxID=1679076 RepID=UPI0021D5CA4F|nr:zinc ribbon domain-containing protein [Natronobiforma cellulositropha]
MWKTFAWQLLGLLFYLGGMVVFLVVVVNVYIAEPNRSLENLSSAHLPFFGLSVLLIVFGRYIGHRFGSTLAINGYPTNGEGSESHRDRVLREYGYDPSLETREESTVEYEDQTDALVCPNCGERNEPGYDYCGNCASKLRE